MQDREINKNVEFYLLEVVVLAVCQRKGHYLQNMQ